MKSKLDYKQELQSITTHYSTQSFHNTLSFNIVNTQENLNIREAFAKINKIISKKIINKKRYCFQVLKQFILFFDSSESESLLSVSKYDPLIFSDEKIHTLFKILQTQYMQRLIWSFINLKTENVKSKVNQFICTSEQTLNKVKQFHKIESFYMIKKLSEDKKKYTRVLNSENIINISINNTPQKKYKFQRSFKNQDSQYKRTAISSEYNEKNKKNALDFQYIEQSKKTIAQTQYNQASKKSINISQYNQRPKYHFSLKQIACHSCNCYRNYCCCYFSYNSKSVYNLQQRIEYLQRLEEIYSKINKQV